MRRYLKCNKNRVKRMECEAHDKSLTDDDKRQTLSTLVSWHTILSAAKS